jgi:hypothetical protein
VHRQVSSVPGGNSYKPHMLQCNSQTKVYVILCYIDASRLQKAAVTLCIVRNSQAVHKRHDQNMKCVLSQFIASANLFAMNMAH